MNRAEYSNALRDLFDLPLELSLFLPPDDSSNGFDNQADSHGLSPAQLQAYLSAADEVSGVALGRATAMRQATFRIPTDETQNYHVETLPFGTRGGTAFEYVFPADGKYSIKTFAMTTGNRGDFRPFGEMKGEQLEVLIDGERVALFDWDKEFSEDLGRLKTLDVLVPVAAGPHTVGVTFIARNFAPGLDLNQAFDRSTIATGGLPGYSFYPHVGSVRVDGPIDGRPATDSPSRRRIFLCQPRKAADEARCAHQIIEALANRAYRGKASRKDRKTLFGVYQSGARRAGFESGIEAVLQRTLADPKFICRIEEPARRVGRGRTYEIDDFDLAARLTFFLWSSVPDDELLAAAKKNQLHKPDVLRAQVARLIADPRSRALAKNFAGQWLGLRALETLYPPVSQFPDFDNNLRQAMRTEAELFFDSILRENRPVTELLSANYTFLDERLARHYGIGGVRGSRFRRVQLMPQFDVRRGLLGKAAIMTVSSDQFTRNLTIQLLTYAIGRGIEYTDMPLVRSIEQQAGQDGYRFQSLISAIALSEGFRTNTFQGPPK